MPRPRMFKEGEQAAINIYLHKDQLDYLKRWAIRANKSPSGVIRSIIDKERGSKNE